MKYKVSIRETVITLSCIGIFTNPYIEFGCIFLSSVLILLRQNFILKFPKALAIIALFVFTTSIVLSLIHNYQIVKTLQQFLMISAFIICYSIIFRYLSENMDGLFYKYLQIAFFVAIIGLIQFIVYYLLSRDIIVLFSHNAPEMNPGIIRITSILHEPGYLAGILIPAGVYHFNSLIENKSKKNIIHFSVILASIILTFSNAAYIVFSLALGYLLILKRKKSVLLFIAGFILFLSFKIPITIKKNNIFFERPFRIMEQTFSGLNELNVNMFEKLNTSTFALLSNLYVSVNAPSRIFGTGLGTHEQNYKSVYSSLHNEYGQNAQDGYSLLIRIYSEFGIVGIFLLFLFIVKNHNSKNIINLSVLFLIFQFFIRGGHYTLYGTIFFFFFYYYSGQNCPNQDLKHKDL